MAYKYYTSVDGNYNLLKEMAKSLRQNPTPAESFLWEFVRGKKLGYRFRRQHPIGDFIADFVCLEKMLIIEVDGEYHYVGNQPFDDKVRTEVLEGMGYRVVRFDNNEILQNIEKVILTIKNNLI